MAIDEQVSAIPVRVTDDAFPGGGSGLKQGDVEMMMLRKCLSVVGIALVLLAGVFMSSANAVEVTADVTWSLDSSTLALPEEGLVGRASDSVIATSLPIDRFGVTPDVPLSLRPQIMVREGTGVTAGAVGYVRFFLSDGVQFAGRDFKASDLDLVRGGGNPASGVAIRLHEGGKVGDSSVTFRVESRSTDATVTHGLRHGDGLRLAIQGLQNVGHLRATGSRCVVRSTTDTDVEPQITNECKLVNIDVEFTRVRSVNGFNFRSGVLSQNAEFANDSGNETTLNQVRTHGLLVVVNRYGLNVTSCGATDNVANACTFAQRSRPAIDIARHETFAGGLVTDEMETALLDADGTERQGFRIGMLDLFRTGSNTGIQFDPADFDTILIRDPDTGPDADLEALDLGMVYHTGALRNIWGLVAEDRFRVTVDAASLEGLTAFADWDQDEMVDANEVIPAEGLTFPGDGAGSFVDSILSDTRADDDRNIPVYILADGETPLSPDTYTLSLALDFSNPRFRDEMASAPPVSSSFGGVVQDGFAYAIPSCTQVERGSILLTNETVTPLIFYLRGVDQTGRELGGLMEVDASIIRGGGGAMLEGEETLELRTEHVEQIFGLNEGGFSQGDRCTGEDTWSGRAQLTFFTEEGNMTVMPLLRNSDGGLRDLGGFTGLKVGDEQVIKF